MTGRYLPWAGEELIGLGRFDWERLMRRCEFRKPATKLIALLLSTWASEDGSSVRPGRERLIAASNLSKGYVSKQLVALEELGLIYKVRNASFSGRGGAGLASVYQLSTPANLYKDFLEEPGSLEPMVVEEGLEWYKFQHHVHPSTPDVEPEQVLPSALDTATELQDQVHSEEDHVHYEPEQVHFEKDQVLPSGLHQPSNTTQVTPIKSINQSSCAAPFETHARDAVDNFYDDGLSEEDERQRQMKELQKLMDTKATVWPSTEGTPFHESWSDERQAS